MTRTDHLSRLISEQAHRRYNPLTGEWFLVSPGRTKRPWNGESLSEDRVAQKEHDPDCYLCPRNTRVSGEKNPDYKGPFIFTNDTPSLKPHSELDPMDDGLFKMVPATGTSRVICYSERHDLTMSQLPLEVVHQVVNAWSNESESLGSSHRVVQIFENKGAMMGCSNPHPHGQIWASDFVPHEIQKEDLSQKKYYEQNGESMLLAYLKLELMREERIVVENDHWAVLTPFWAVWPFETLLIPKQQVSFIEALDTAQKESLAEIISQHLKAYDNLFNTSFPYSMGWHSAPYTPGSKEYFQLHAHYYPPLLRSATVKKHMVGYEMLAERGRDTTPEFASAQLRKNL